MKFIFILTLLTVSTLAQAETPHQDHPSVHGMMVMGTSKIYLSHLPMFHTPHDYQVILEVEMDENAKKTYLAHQNKFTETVYTLVPEAFVLPEMIQNPRPFVAKIFKGHFERGGSLIAENATILIKNVIYSKKFIPTEIKPTFAKYLLFGNDHEQFIAHVLAAKPDFDQILQVKAPAQEQILLELQDLPNAPLKEGPLQEKSIVIKKSLYLEFDDLSF